MKKASLAAAFAASLCLNPVSLSLAAEGALAEEARVAEEQLLGAADEEARFLSLSALHARDCSQRRHQDVV